MASPEDFEFVLRVLAHFDEELGRGEQLRLFTPEEAENEGAQGQLLIFRGRRQLPSAPATAVHRQFEGLLDQVERELGELTDAEQCMLRNRYVDPARHSRAARMLPAAVLNEMIELVEAQRRQ